MGADRLPTKGPTSSFERLADSWRLEPLPSGRLGVNEALRAPVVWMSGLLVIFAVAGACVSSITTDRFGFITGALIAVAAGAALVLTANMRRRTFARTFRAMTAVTKGAFIIFVLTSIASTSALTVIGVAASSWNLDGQQANLLVLSLSVLSVTLTAGYVTAMPPAVSLDWRGSRLPRLIAVSAGVVQASAILVLVTSYERFARSRRRRASRGARPSRPHSRVRPGQSFAQAARRTCRSAAAPTAAAGACAD